MNNIIRILWDVHGVKLSRTNIKLESKANFLFFFISSTLSEVAADKFYAYLAKILHTNEGKVLIILKESKV
jgi:hypothetical protein